MQGTPIFMENTLEDQAQELRKYFKSLGAEISEEKSPKGVEDDLHKIIGVCEACFQEGKEAEVENVLNDIVSIMVFIPIDRSENIVLAFCERLTKAPNQTLALVCLKALWLLFQSLDEKSQMRYHVYYHLVVIAKQTGRVSHVFRDVETLNQQFASCPPSSEKLQKLYRLLHEVLLKNDYSDQAAKVMIELLGTYTAENASYVREDAMQCIVTALADPHMFLLDPLLALKPVTSLQGELVHDLLTIFVNDNLASYVKFHSNHREFVEVKLGLNHEQNMKKMRLLSFMQLAESCNELPFALIEQELQIESDEVEAFIIEVLKTKLVRARMDQHTRKVHVSSTMHRTFGRPQWQQLRDLLHHWKANLAQVQDGMVGIVKAQAEMTMAK